MPLFIVTIETKDQSDAVSAQLRCCLAIAGFRKTVAAANDDSFELPQNQYVVEHARAASAVLAQVLSVARSANVVEEPRVVVAEFSTCTISGLRAVNRS
jgi:hypothetical protein